jgi:polar amino acid transport system substrate-binding protein
MNISCESLPEFPFLLRIRAVALVVAGLVLGILVGCKERPKITSLQQLSGKEFAVPTGTIADRLVQSRIPDAKFQYFNSALDAAMAVKAGKADAAAYDEPILRNIAAKTTGVKVLSEKITTDEYGFAVRLDDHELKAAIDGVVSDLRLNGKYGEMLQRWLPQQGPPKPMPVIETSGDQVLRFGTSAVTEPFSFIDGSMQVVGMDIELASLVAKRLNKRLVVVNMEFGSLIPALVSGKVDMIGACITISSERAKKVLFSEPYYTGGISALVRQ